MSLTAAVWPQFATQVFRGGIGRLTCIGGYVTKQVTTFTFRAQATTCSKHHTRTVMDAGCECAPYEYGRLTLATAGLLLLVLQLKMHLISIISRVSLPQLGRVPAAAAYAVVAEGCDWSIQ